jgi:acetyl-CoA/propionyl-CoA carboxylase biotin carboxyl carrier protein
MRFDLRIDGDDRAREHEILAERVERVVELVVDGEELDAEVTVDEDSLRVDLPGSSHEVTIEEDGRARVDGHRVEFAITDFDPSGGPGEETLGVEAGGRVEPPMPGKILSVNVGEGDEVETGDVLATLEAMKMQSDIEAPRDGTVLMVDVAEGDAVEGDHVMFAIGDPDDE